MGDGTLGERTKFWDFGLLPEPKSADVDTDGMRTDSLGNLYVTRNGAAQVLVFKEDATLLKTHALTELDNPTNLDFGGDNGKTLFVVGRCKGNGWSEGNGCVELVDAEAPGREWSWLRPDAAMLVV